MTIKQFPGIMDKMIVKCYRRYFYIMPVNGSVPSIYFHDLFEN